jgi:ankyrin repeat protein
MLPKEGPLRKPSDSFVQAREVLDQAVAPLSPNQRARKNCELWKAARDGSLTQTRLNKLINDGADVNAEGFIEGHGEATALFAALNASQKEAAELLIKAPKIVLATQTSLSKRTALHEAVALNNAPLVQILLERCETAHYIDAKDCDGRTALHQAVCFSAYPVIIHLLNYGANVDELDAQHLSPLHLLILNPFRTYEYLKRTIDTHYVARALINYAAEVNTTADSGTKLPSIKSCVADERLQVIRHCTMLHGYVTKEWFKFY